MHLLILSLVQFRLKHVPPDASLEFDPHREPAPMFLRACLTYAEVTVDDALRYRLSQDTADLAEDEASEIDVWLHSQLIAPPSDSTDAYQRY